MWTRKRQQNPTSFREWGLDSLSPYQPLGQKVIPWTSLVFTQKTVRNLSKLGGEVKEENPPTTQAPSSKLLRNTVDSGADVILLKPISTAALVSRIEMLVGERKPFVVTCDYIGPDRRKSSDRPSTVPFLDVPNLLSAKARGEGISKVESQIPKMISELNSQKLDRYVTQFRWLANALTEEVEKHGVSETFYEHLNRLTEVAEDATIRSRGTAHANMAVHCKSLIELSASLHQIAKGPDAKKVVPSELAKLEQIASAIQADFVNRSEAIAAKRAQKSGK